MDPATLLHDPPQGFRFSGGEDGRWTLHYGLWPDARIARRFIRLVAGPILGLAACIVGAVFAAGDPGVLFIMVVGAVLQLLVYCVVAWAIWSVSRYTFRQDELVFERSLFFYRRRVVIRREEVRAVVLKPWRLEVVTTARIPVLTYHLPENGRWLGAVLARWAGVSVESMSLADKGPEMKS